MLGSAIAMRQVADDGTIKLLLKLADGKTVESVVMPAYQEDRVAGCVSSQVGCAMACDFCATTQSGFERNLSAGEMVEQFLHLRREAKAAGRRLQTVVFMGMGEPMLNLENVLEAARRMAGEGLGALGWRQITVSTVGIVPGIDALAAADLNINLAVSLHAPDDATRAQTDPVRPAVWRGGNPGGGRPFSGEARPAGLDPVLPAGGRERLAGAGAAAGGAAGGPPDARQPAPLQPDRREPDRADLRAIVRRRRPSVHRGVAGSRRGGAFPPPPRSRDRRGLRPAQAAVNSIHLTEGNEGKGPVSSVAGN